MSKFGQMDVNIVVIGLREKCMGLENIAGLMGNPTTASTTRTKSKDTEFSNGQTVSNTKVHGWQASSMARAN